MTAGTSMPAGICQSDAGSVPALEALLPARTSPALAAGSMPAHLTIQQRTPDMTPERETAVELDPADLPHPRPRPRPRFKGPARGTLPDMMPETTPAEGLSALTNDQSSFSQHSLTLPYDPTSIIDPPIMLDPSLDPHFDGTTPGGEIDMARLNVGLGLGLGPTWGVSNTPEPSPRRKGKSADAVAIEEAQRYITDRRRRR
jgi:hypothetical protein